MEDFKDEIIDLFKGIGLGIIILIVFAIILGIFLCTVNMLVLDFQDGATAGTITSVDGTFWGTTNLYIKTTETSEETYCIENNQELVNKAKELVGKKVKISYGKRVGIYWFGQCHQSPVESIEVIE